jgi:peptidyl-prolyl cis-trans isomerase SurA
MKIKPFLSGLIIFLYPLLGQAQVLNEKTLMTVGDEKVSAGEFIRMYKKSLYPGNQIDIDSYLQQFITFKLKVADAVNKGIDTTRAFRNELSGYRNQLAENYLTDSQTKEKLLQKTYQRSLTEVNAWHILVNCPEEAAPDDTLKAWQKAAGIRERIINGESFEQVARAASDDPSVRMNGGNLGYFTVFQMIMPFEDAAYNLKKGEISAPVRTPYGYHIIRLADKRPSKGKIRVAHIMKAAPPGSDEKEIKQAEEDISNIYKELQAGGSFSELARKYSDHKESASAGGELRWFGTGEIISDFANAAFSIPDTGMYSKPVRTTSGWHIIKLLEKKAPGSFEETRSYLESKINQSYLNSLSKKSFIEKLKKEYNFRITQTAYNWFVENTDTLIIRGMARYNRTNMPAGYLYSFANQHLTTREFAGYIERRGSRIITSDPVYFINQSIETRAADHIYSYENSVLEKKYPDFRFLIKEFHDGILLFEASGEEVWNKVQEDSLGLKRYYEDHKGEFLTRKGIEAKIYTLRSSRGEKSLWSSYKRYSRKPGTDELMTGKFNRHNDTLLIIYEGKWFTGDDPEIDKIKWTAGAQLHKINKFPSIIVVNKILEPEPLPFKEVQGEMMTGYQEYLENEWIGQLKGKYPVKIDNLVLDEVRKSILNE